MPMSNSGSVAVRPPACQLQPDGRVAALEQPVGDDAAQDLERAGLQRQRSGLRDGVCLAVDDLHRHPERGEFGGKGETRRSRADDQNVDRVRRGFVASVGLG